MWGWLNNSSTSQDEWDPLGGPGTPTAARHSVDVAVTAPTTPSAQPPVPSTPQTRAPATPVFQTPARSVPTENVEEFQHFSRLVDYKHLVHRLPAGMHVTPSQEDETVWNGVVFVRGGPYEGGVFKFQLHLRLYPMQPPVVVLLTRLYHPCVNALSGRLTLPLVAAWKPQAHRVWHVLAAFDEALKQPLSVSNEDTDEQSFEVSNPDAAQMGLTRPDTFQELCRVCAAESLNTAQALVQGTAPAGQGMEF